MKEDGRVRGGTGNSGRSCMHLVSGLCRCLLHSSFLSVVLLLVAVQTVAASKSHSLLALIAHSDKDCSDKVDKFRHTKPPPAGSAQILLVQLLPSRKPVK